MISKVNSWAIGIIVAIIIGAIIQMVLPDNKNKKYIKVIVGIYVLFSILNPVIGKSFNINNYELNDIFMLNEIDKNSNSQNNSSEYEDRVKKVFEKKAVTSIKEQLNDKGYDSNNIKIDIDEKYNIIHIKIEDVIEYKKNELNINTVEIDIKHKKATGIAISDKDTIKKYLKEQYGISENEIEIQ